MSTEWCNGCNEFTEYEDDGIMPYGDQHKASCRHCTVCGEKVFGRLRRVAGMTASQQRTEKIMQEDREPTPPPPHAEQSVAFLIQGSRAKPYIVYFWRAGKNLTSSCTCPAGRFKSVCKHRLNLLTGDTTAIIGESIGCMEMLKMMIEATDVAKAFARYQKHASKENLQTLKDTLID
jgi:hypothetical protein